jgi:hypothetical protein
MTAQLGGHARQIIKAGRKTRYNWQGRIVSLAGYGKTTPMRNSIMANVATPFVLHGIVKPDGTLEVKEKVALPAGRVQITVEPLPDLSRDDPFWQRMQAIWDARNAAGLAPRSVEEVEGERRAVRDEWEDRTAKIESIQQQGRSNDTPGERAQ